MCVAGSRTIVAASRTKLRSKEPMVAVTLGVVVATRGDVGHHPRRRVVDMARTATKREKNVDDGCPEALLPGALTRRLSACRPCLTRPPSLPPAPPSYLRLASSSSSSPCALRVRVPPMFLPPRNFLVSLGARDVLPHLIFCLTTPSARRFRFLPCHYHSRSFFRR